MENDGSTWLICGLNEDDPDCIKTVDGLCAFIEEVGILPLFKNSIRGFSAEEHCLAGYWWSGDEERDPWEWRRIIASRGEIAYGKFFERKACFLSKKWLPYFLNARRDGYDFDALWDDEKVGIRLKKLMDVVTDDTEIYSNELKERAGFGKGGEKNFEGTLTELQMRGYLCVRDFRQRLNKHGEPYGWHIALYSTPEHIFGAELTKSAYGEEPERSRERIREHIRELYPHITEKELKLL